MPANGLTLAYRTLLIETAPVNADRDQSNISVSGLRKTPKLYWKPLPENINPETWSIPPSPPTTTFEDGQIFDLGNRTLEVVYTPGHSPGSVCLLDKKNRILFSGDTFFPGPLYAHPEDVDVADYIDSINKVEALLGEYDYVCSGHNDPWVRSEVIARVSQAFSDIMNGEGEFIEDRGLRRYHFDGFDILIRTDQITKYGKSEAGT